MKALIKMGALVSLVAASAAAQATVIQSNYTVNANNTDPGLVVHTKDVSPNPFTHDLMVGDSVTFNLFKIWTDETTVNSDDRRAKPISVDFGFILPETGSSTVSGNTDGVSKLFGFIQKGTLTWDGPADFFFGDNDDGQIRISLSDEIFNEGLFGLTEGKRHGATVQATLNLISNPVAVPEPGALGLFALALIGLGFVSTRRRGAPRI